MRVSQGNGRVAGGLAGAFDGLPILHTVGADLGGDMKADYTYRGYGIVRALHPSITQPDRMAWDIVDGDRLRKANIATIETAKRVIDTMVRYGYWPDIEMIG